MILCNSGQVLGLKTGFSRGFGYPWGGSGGRGGGGGGGKVVLVLAM